MLGGVHSQLPGETDEICPHDLQLRGRVLGTRGRVTLDSAALGDLVKHARRAAGLTQEGLAERAGLSARAISDLERHVNRTPRPGTVQLLVAALSLSSQERELFETVASAKPSGFS